MASIIAKSHTYTGREWDKETGLYYYRARYYDHSVGRFISKDPIGFAGGDVNLYGYVQNNPVNNVDPSGLYSWNDVDTAWNHYCDGSGTSWSTNIGSINWGSTKSQIEARIKSMVGSCCKNASILVNFDIGAQTEEADKYIIGRHTIHVIGVLQLNSNCSWSFNGYMSSSSGYDPYDFNPSNRGTLGEVLTWIGRNACPITGKAFNININGSIPLSFGGRIK